jgi:hypothetical protein
VEIRSEVVYLKSALEQNNLEKLYYQKSEVWTKTVFGLIFNFFCVRFLKYYLKGPSQQIGSAENGIVA